MPPSAVTKQKDTETDVAVLQVQYGNLGERVNEVKTDVSEVKSDVKELRDHMDHRYDGIELLIKTFHTEAKGAHDKLTTKVNSLEAWKWMVMGGGVVVGSLIVPFIQNLFQLLGAH